MGKFSEEKILELNADVIEVLDGYKDFSDEKKHAAIMFVLKKLNGFIIKECNKYKRAGILFEDLEQEAKVAVIQALPNYNPRLFMPTTYFAVYINSALNKYCIPDGLSNYYHAQEYEIKKALIAEGIDPDDMFNIPNDSIAAITKKSIKTIKEVKDQMFSTVSLASVGEDVPSNSYNSSPEALILQEERNRVLTKAFAELEELEKILLEYMYLNDNPYSARKMVALINNNLDKFHLEKKIDAKFVNQRKNVAAMKIRNFPGMDKIFVFDKENYQEYVPVEQSDIDDIENAVAIGILVL